MSNAMVDQALRFSQASRAACTTARRSGVASSFTYPMSAPHSREKGEPRGDKPAPLQTSPVERKRCAGDTVVAWFHGGGSLILLCSLDSPVYCGERLAHFPGLSREGDGALEAGR
jgi:hypothetical protein